LVTIFGCSVLHDWPIDYNTLVELGRVTGFRGNLNGIAPQRVTEGRTVSDAWPEALVIAAHETMNGNGYQQPKVIRRSA
jgi:hypothetical protein